MPGRHLPPGCRRPVREHGVGHAERGWLQSSPVIPGLGFCLGTRAQMFTLTAACPQPGPGQAPADHADAEHGPARGEPYLAFGTPAGISRTSGRWPFFLRHVLFGMNLQEAIDAPAFHTRHFPSSFYPRESWPLAIDVEERAGAQVLAELRRRGHQVTVRPPWSLGRVSAVARDQGMLYAAANPAACRATPAAERVPQHYRGTRLSRGHWTDALARRTRWGRPGGQTGGEGRRPAPRRPRRRPGASPRLPPPRPRGAAPTRRQHQQPQPRGQHRRLAA